MKKIWLITGKARHGKGSVAQILKELYTQDESKAVETIFAKYIKGYAIDFFGWDGKEETKHLYRDFLQKIGTEIIRERLNKPNFHVDRICEDIEILSDFFDAFIVSDTRFMNECDIPREKFGTDKVVVVKVVRENFESPLTIEQQNHPSETALDNYEDFDYVVKASNLDELHSKIKEIYEIEKRKDNNII